MKRPRPPAGLRADAVEVGRETYLVLSFPSPTVDASALTAAELAVARAVVAGESNAEIARARGRSPRTIGNQVASIFRKLGVGSRLELARKLR
jgi:DNA-binding NarL/FixJ family response regulator